MSTASAIGHVFALERDAFSKARLQRCSNGGQRRTVVVPNAGTQSAQDDQSV